jgi:Na+/H+ antiporter NhaD/arsenite permease-like protein
MSQEFVVKSDGVYVNTSVGLLQVDAKTIALAFKLETEKQQSSLSHALAEIESMLNGILVKIEALKVSQPSGQVLESWLPKSSTSKVDSTPTPAAVASGKVSGVVIKTPAVAPIQLAKPAKATESSEVVVIEPRYKMARGRRSVISGDALSSMGTLAEI